MHDSFADIKSPDKNALPESVQDAIRTAYSTLKAKMPGFRDRFQQRKMIAEVAAILAGQKSEKKILVVEGPTGTGKTLAYLLAAIPLAQHLDKKLVISSATVALQEQLVFQDLPLLQEKSGLEFTLQIAKGRGRYACLSKLRNLGASSNDTQLDFASELWEKPPKAHEVKTIHKVFKLYKDGKWNGDLDLVPVPLSRTLWPKISNTFHGCTANRCPDYKRCAFFLERRKTSNADIIVANHDLVLADIAAGGGSVLPPVDSSFYIFDEAHKLPGKAIAHFTAHASVLGSGEWLARAAKIFSQNLSTPALTTISENMIELATDLSESMQEFHTLLQSLPLAAKLEQQEHVRFAFGIPDSEIIQFGETRVFQPLKKLYLKLNTALDLIKQDFDDNNTDDRLQEQKMEALGLMFGRVENLFRLWQLLLSADDKDTPPYARWLGKIDNDDFVLNISPISAAQKLDRQLWQESAGMVLTSATLTTLNSFSRFNQRSGLGEHNAEYLRLPSPFDLKRVRLEIPNMQQSPKNPLAHTKEIGQMLADLLGVATGTLFLFSSRRQMQDVYEQLSLKLKPQVLIQGDESKQEILRRHKARIDKGQASTIFGLDSFAEGLDLPGKLCEHVIIAKLPFAVPTSPIEQATSEYIESQGKNHFFTISVPDASIKLIQACGRLMRSETDRGQITILDTRLVTTGYGKTILKSLPDYKLSQNT